MFQRSPRIGAFARRPVVFALTCLLLLTILPATSIADESEAGAVVWRQTFDADGANVNLAGIPTDPGAFFTGTVDGVQVTDDAQEGDLGPSGRYVTITSDGTAEVKVETEAFDGLVTLLNALPPGEYDLALESTLRTTGRHVRKITFRADDPDSDKPRWPARWIKPDVSETFTTDRAEFQITIVSADDTDTLRALVDADPKAFVFVEGGVGLIRLSHFVGNDKTPGNVALDDLRFVSRSIGAVAARQPARLISVAELSSANHVFMFRRSEPAAMSATLASVAPIDVELSAQMRLTAWAGGPVLREATGRLTLPAGGRATQPFDVDVKDLPFGVYVATWRFTDAATGADLLTASAQLGVCSETEIGKARPGEFLFGLDTSLPPAHVVTADGTTPSLLVWTRWLGTDIVRGGFYGWSQSFLRSSVEERLREVRDGRALYEEYDVQVVKMLDPPDDKFLDDMPLIEERMTAFAEQVAEEHAGWLTYYEIGNEPDLPGFYEGPMERYVRQYKDLHAAIKRGNPDAIVMNGGFAYRVDRMIEFLDAVDPDDIEALAYHAHGAGVAAERMAFRRLKGLAVERGLGDLPLIQTESGLSAGSRRQEIEKARTLIEKMTYAQSQNVPLFLWFRLFIDDRTYGNTRSMLQPRPSLLAYRNLAETLRHHRFTTLVDSGVTTTELYLFEEIDGPGRVVVGWTNGAGVEHDLRLSVGAADEVNRLDMFGNPTPLAVGRGGAVGVTFGEDPMFLVWDAAETGHVVAVDPGFLPDAGSVQLIPDASDALTVTVRNPWDVPLTATLDLTATSATSVTTEPASIELSLEAGEVRAVPVDVVVGTHTDGIDWPEAWTLFSRTDADAIDLAELDAIPQTLPGADGTSIDGVRVFPRSFEIDIASAADFRRKLDTRADAVVMAEVVSDRERTITVGGAGDYWMDWFVNGERVFDTMDRGNGATFTVAAHTFEVPLKQGRNLIAIRVQAGRHGWRLIIGPPEPVRQALGNPPSDRLELRLTAAGEVIAQQTRPIRFVRPLPILAEIDAIDQLAPAAVLTDRHVVNYFERVPGDARWWNGDDDLSATVWMARDETSLCIVVDVADQDHDVSSNDPAENDHIELAIVDGDDITRLRIGGGHALDIPAKVVRDDANQSTRYVMHVPIADFAREAIGLNLAVHDRDDGTMKQRLQWHPNLDANHEDNRAVGWETVQLGIR